MRNLITFCICLIISIDCISQTTSMIEGKWDVCTRMTLDSLEDCSSNVYLTYEFHSDGTYSDSREYTVYGKKYKYHGVWSFNGTVLMIDAADENGITIPPHYYEIFWINDYLLYTKGTEGPDGPTVYTYYKKN